MAIRSLAGRSSSTAEIPEIQLCGCVLVAVLGCAGLLESGAMKDILPHLVNTLKLPCTDPTFSAEDWFSNFQAYYATKRCAY